MMHRREKETEHLTPIRIFDSLPRLCLLHPFTTPFSLCFCEARRLSAAGGGWCLPPTGWAHLLSLGWPGEYLVGQVNRVLEWILAVSAQGTGHRCGEATRVANWRMGLCHPSHSRNGGLWEGLRQREPQP